MRHGSRINPPNRFEKTRSEADDEHLEWDVEYLRGRENRNIEYLADDSQSIVSENNSPDIPFRYSLNPYRGCLHGCSYCYARPGHEFLGLNAGLDFETKIVVKHRAAELLREFLTRSSWRPEPITFSGVTDCYQPAERKFGLTRACLQLAAECRQPISIITKNALVVRDLDILQDLASDNLVHVFLSITTLQPDLAREMEPRTSIPAARLRAIEMLAKAQVPVGVMMAPLIPGLNDSEIDPILSSAADAGASVASYIMLRLPLTVAPVFQEWLKRTQPLQADKVWGRVQAVRGGRTNDSQWGQRMVGQGEIAEQIRHMFRLFKNKHGLGDQLAPQNCELFRAPLPKSGQQRLF